MARSPAAFKQRDVTRFVKGLALGGVKAARIEVSKDGRISAVLDGVSPTDEDAELVEFRRKHGYE